MRKQLEFHFSGKYPEQIVVSTNKQQDVPKFWVTVISASVDRLAFETGCSSKKIKFVPSLHSAASRCGTSRKPGTKKWKASDLDGFFKCRRNLVSTRCEIFYYESLETILRKNSRKTRDWH